MSQTQLLQYFQLWLARHGAANATIKKAKGILKAAVQGGEVILNTSTKALTYAFKVIVLDGGSYRVETSIKSLGHLPVGQSAYAA